MKLNINDNLCQKIVFEICKEEGIEIIHTASKNLIKLVKNRAQKHLTGSVLEINSSLSEKIADAKSFTYELLCLSNIPAAEIVLVRFNSREDFDYDYNKEKWEKLIDFAKKHKFKVVCKPFFESSGYDVFFINDQWEFLAKTSFLIRKYKGLHICPYYKIKNEFRVIVLDHNPLLIYQKNRPVLIGDGKSTILELLDKKYKGSMLQNIKKDFMENMTYSLKKVLEKDKKICVNLKHNLSRGATPKIVTKDLLKRKLAELAIQATKAINITFASVDIIEVNNLLLVLEINSMVRMENFAQHIENGYEIAKDIYRKAILHIFRS